MDALAERISLLLSETQCSDYGNESEDDGWGADDDQDEDDWLTLDLQFLETAARTAKRDSTKAQVVLGLITNGEKVREWSPIGGRKGTGLQSSRLGRVRSKSEERPLLRSERRPLLERGTQGDSNSSIIGVGLAKPMSFAAHRHSVTLVDTSRPPRRTSVARKPMPLSFPAPLHPRTSTDHEPPSSRLATSRSGKRDSGSNFVNFSRPLSVSLISPPAISTEDVAQVSKIEEATPLLTQLDTPKAIREGIHSSPISPRIPPPPPRKVVRDDIGLPRTPSGNTLATAQPIFQRLPPPNISASETKAKPDVDTTPDQPHKRVRKGSIWTTLPICGLISVPCIPHREKEDKGKGKHMRLLDEETSISGKRTKVDHPSQFAKVKLTEDNLRRWEDEIGYARRPVNREVLPIAGLEIHNRNDILVPTALDKKLPTPPNSPPAGILGSPSNPAELSHSPPPPPPKDSDSFAPFYHHPNMVVELPKPICKVCNEAKALSQFSVRQCTRTCTHPPHTCRDCVAKWIEISLREQGPGSIGCPECSEPMGWEDIRFFATTEVFARYDDLSTRAILNNIDTFFWCLSPHCANGHIHPTPISTHPTFSCSDCGHTYCINHPSTPHHSGLSCPEYEALLTSTSPTSAIENYMHEQDLDKARADLEREKEGERMVQQVGKRCPNALCGWWIEKNEGCDRMVCFKCGWAFCWECGASFQKIEKRGNKFHREECRWYG